MRELQQISDAELEEVTGGKGDGSGSKNKYRVKNAGGADIRKEPNENSQKMGNFSKGTVIQCGMQAPKTGKYTWLSVKPQKGKPSGYVAKETLEKVK